MRKAFDIGVVAMKSIVLDPERVDDDAGARRERQELREELMLELVARERAAGRVTELGPAELAFTAADCDAYLRLARGRERDPRARASSSSAGSNRKGEPTRAAPCGVSSHVSFRLLRVGHDNGGSFMV